MPSEPRNAYSGDDAIRQHVEIILKSPGFAHSHRLAAFLRWIVEQSLAGNTAAINERNIGLAVYQRPPDFDPKIDGTVRAEAMRLRHKLRECYASWTGGPERIDVPKGAYVPQFTGFAVVDISHAESHHLQRNLAWICALTVSIVLLSLAIQRAAALSHTAQANQLLDHAEDLMRIGDNISAVPIARQSVTLAPQAAKPHRILATALRNIGHMAESIVESRLAQSLANRDSEEALQTRAVRATAEGRYAQAEGLYNQLVFAHPQSFDALLNLAKAENIRSPEAALATIQKIRHLPQGIANPEVERISALALANLASTGRRDTLAAALSSIKRARFLATAAHSQGALGRVLVLEAGIEANAGLPNDYLASMCRAHDICLETHDDLCLANVLRVEGNVQLLAAHNYRKALHTYEQALALALQWQNPFETNNILDGIDATAEQLSKVGGDPIRRMSILDATSCPLVASHRH